MAEAALAYGPFASREEAESALPAIRADAETGNDNCDDSDWFAISPLFGTVGADEYMSELQELTPTTPSAPSTPAD